MSCSRMLVRLEPATLGVESSTLPLLSKLVDLTLCMLGKFCRLLIIFFSNKKKILQEYHKSNSLDQDQANCLQRLSADNTSKQSVKVLVLAFSCP